MLQLKSKNPYLCTSSKFYSEFQEICENWFKEIDNCLSKNLNQLTCNDIKDFYVTLFTELKNWRSNSTNFTGFSELLLFRTLYHLIEQSKGEEFNLVETGDSKDFVRFKSDNYEIGQSVPIKVNGKYKYPDISIKQKNAANSAEYKLISVISIKISVVNDDSIDNETKSFESFKLEYPEVKGLLIMFVKADLSKERKEKAGKVGLKTLVLEGNNEERICDVLGKFI